MAPAAKRRKVGDAAGVVQGGLSAVSAALQMKALAEENAMLRKQLAAVNEAAAKITYSTTQQSAFLKQMHRAPSVELLDLCGLVRTTNRYTSDWNHKWKPDKKLDAVVASLLSATDDVKGLDLGDATWASEEKYAKDLQQLLRKYKKNLTMVRVTIRAMVERAETEKGKNKKQWLLPSWAPIPLRGAPSKVDVLALIGSMPKLTTLKVVFGTNTCRDDAYAGEFNPAFQKKKLFPKLSELEVTLTEEWCKVHEGEEDKTVQSEAGGDEDAEANAAAAATALLLPGYTPLSKHRLEWLPDRRLTDMLQHMAGAITVLDMRWVRKPAKEAAFLALVPRLTALRSLAVRAELLPLVSEDMKRLESVEVVVSAELSGATVQSVVQHVAGSRALRGVKRMELRVVDGVRVQEKHGALLEAVAEHCSRLEAVRVTGSGWKTEDLAALLQGGAPIRELYLDQCGALEETHLALVADLPQLEVAWLPSSLRGKGHAHAVVERGLRDLRWQFTLQT